MVIAAAACQEPEAESEDEEVARASEVADDMDIESEATSSRDDELSGSWNLRLDGPQAWYLGAEVISCADPSGCPYASGYIDPPDFLDLLCEERDFCVDTAVPVEFEAGITRPRFGRYTMSVEGGANDFDGILINSLGIAIFHIGAGYGIYDGVYVDALAGYAAQLGITPTRPEIDPNHEGDYDGAIFIEVAGGANIASFVVPAGGAIIALPFDAVNCDQYPDDCTR